MKNYLLPIVIIILFGACNTLNDSNTSNEEPFSILGIWVGEEQGTGSDFFFYFTADKLLYGILGSGFFGGGDWKIEGNDIFFDGEAMNHDVPRFVSVYIPFAIIDYNTIKIRELMLTRIDEQDLSRWYTSREHFDELLKDF